MTTSVDRPGLAQRLRDHAALHEQLDPYDRESRQWAADLQEAAKLLEAKQQVPTPVLYQHVDGRYGLSFGPANFAVGVPEWYRVPIDVIDDGVDT